MRNLVVGVASAAVLSSIAFGAQAADLIISPSYEQPVAQSSASSDVFTGVYIGGTAGVVTSDNFSDNNSAATVGAQVGYLQQFGAFVIGAEAEALYLNDLKYQLDATGGVQQNWSLAAKARAGVALDHTLIYGTLGYGITSFSGLDAVTVTNPDDVKGGVVFGGGIEAGEAGQRVAEGTVDQGVIEGDTGARLGGERPVLLHAAGRVELVIQVVEVEGLSFRTDDESTERLEVADLGAPRVAAELLSLKLSEVTTPAVPPI